MGKRLTIALAVFALVVVPLAIYTAGHLLLPRTFILWGGVATFAEEFDAAEFGNPKIDAIERQYPQQWMTTAFRPATKLGDGCEVLRCWRHGVRADNQTSKIGRTLTTISRELLSREWQRPCPRIHFKHRRKGIGFVAGWTPSCSSSLLRSLSLPSLG